MTPMDTRSRTVFTSSSSIMKGSAAASTALRARGNSTDERTKTAISPGATPCAARSASQRPIVADSSSVLSTTRISGGGPLKTEIVPLRCSVLPSTAATCCPSTRAAWAEARGEPAVHVGLRHELLFGQARSHALEDRPEALPLVLRQSRFSSEASHVTVGLPRNDLPCVHDLCPLGE